MKKAITARSIQGRLGRIEKLLPPLDLEIQHALLFMCRQALREEMILLDIIVDKEKHVDRLLKGNNDLTRMIEEWIIKNPSPKNKKTTSWTWFF